MIRAYGVRTVINLRGGCNPFPWYLDESRVIARLDQNSSPHRRTASQLSVTELDILTMIGEAKSIPAIAASRGISHKTVRNHLANIYRKLDLRSRTEAMLVAARMGLTSG